MSPLLKSDCRKQLRIKGYDYSQNNYYFVTINTFESRYYYEKIEKGEMVLNEYGKIVEKCINQIPNFSSGTKIDACIVMPNHVHIIIAVERYLVGTNLLVCPMGTTGRSSPTKETIKNKSVSDIVKNFKTYSSKLIHKSGFSSFSWQRSFWDHVIRDERDLEIKETYILNNPKKWELDRYNKESKAPFKKRGIW